jgi:hypothetical protein
VGRPRRHGWPRHLGDPHLASRASTIGEGRGDDERDPGYAVTVLALVGYTAVVTGFLVLLDVE